MLDKIITGGQTGAEQAAWPAATSHSASRPAVGCRQGSLTEDGPRPEFAEAMARRRCQPTATRSDRTERPGLRRHALVRRDHDSTAAHATVGGLPEIRQAVHAALPGCLI